MCRLVESIKVEDSVICNFAYHAARLNETRRALFSSPDYIELADIISVPETCRSGVYKCRIVYDAEIHDITFERYTRRTIRSLKLVWDDIIDYTYKYEDRKKIIDLLAQKETYDDILIIKNNLVTDTSCGNIVFHDGTRWITPKSYLLKGTKRGKLLDERIIIEGDIAVSDISLFQKASIINAMIELGDIIIPIQNIK